MNQYTTSNAAATDIPMAQPYIPPKIAKINKAMLWSLLMKNHINKYCSGFIKCRSCYKLPNSLKEKRLLIR